MTIILHDFWRSSAAYRVRIALALKGVVYQTQSVSLADGEQRAAEYLDLNPQGLVPMLEIDGVRITQSLAIIDWLDSHQPQPRLIPSDPLARAREMEKALVIAADIHPINNLRILNYLKALLGHDQGAIDVWIRHWISAGFASLEAIVDASAPFLSGDAPGLADCCLIPQIYNARRFDTDLTPFPKLVEIDARCTALPAFSAAHPDQARG